MGRLNDLEDNKSKMSFIKSQRLLVGALAFVLVAGMASSAFALVIDDFDEGDLLDITANSGNTPQTDTDTGLDTDKTIGGERTVTVNHVSGETSVMAQANPPSGKINFNSAAENSGIFELWYDGGSDLGGVDLTIGGSGTHIEILLSSADEMAEVTVILETGSGTLTSDMKMTDDSSNQLLKFFFADMTGPGDETDVDSIHIEFEGQENGDYVIDNIGVPQTRIGGTVGSMDTATLLVAGAQANMGLWSLALVGAVAAGAAITYKLKSNKTKQ